MSIDLQDMLDDRIRNKKLHTVLAGSVASQQTMLEREEP